MYKKLQRFYAADDGANGGSGGTPPEPPAPTPNEESVFTPEQQAKIDALIDKAFAKGAAKAAKEAEQKAEREKQTEAERLAADRAALKTEKAQLKVQAALAKEGYTVDEETDTALVGLFAVAPDAVESNIAALKKLLDAKVNQEVDKRLKGVGAAAPQSGKNEVTVGDTINSLFRKTTK
ncbi:MAG: hypothetical protein HFE46_07205 [Clostridia bacterium]|jgi:hypothetical protein|nr:hypothetical protein [Clostridia bacterium]